jgi:hypothetical protein
LGPSSFWPFSLALLTLKVPLITTSSLIPSVSSLLAHSSRLIHGHQ